MKLSTRLAPRRVWRALAQAKADVRGVAAVEFALILPVMLTLYIGSVEVSQLLSADRKVVLLTRTLADLVTQNGSLNATALSGIFSAGSAVLAPLSSGNSQMRVTSIAISSTASKEATVCWSYSSNNWTPISKGQVMTLAEVPQSLRTVGTSVVLSEVKYVYRPVMGYVLTGDINLSERIFMRPRVSTYVGRDDVANSIPATAGAPC